MPRVALYSHDTYGLGHLRRCLKLARALGSRLGSIEGLIVTGSAWAGLFPAPPGFRMLRLPEVVKTGPDRYESRDPARSLEAGLEERRLRIHEALCVFAPDLLVVDNVPCGLRGEVLPALRSLKAAARTRAILALRDILDRTEIVATEWERSEAGEALAGLYDEVWIFGDAEDAHRLITGGPLADASHKVVPCGRLGDGAGPDSPPGVSRSGPVPRNGRPPSVLVTGGGGGDAAPLVRAYLGALGTFRPTVSSRIVLGPDFPLGKLVGAPGLGSPSLRLDSFLPDFGEALAACDLVVSMAGYNTVCEILSSGRPAVLAPRAWPREEQLLRAEGLAREGRARFLHPDSLTPDSLWSAVEAALAGPAPPPRELVGGPVAAARAASLLAPSPVRDVGS